MSSQHAQVSAGANLQGTHQRPSCRGNQQVADLPGFIGPYRVLRAIGAGGMGQIYECLTPGGARVAVKTVLKQYRASQEVCDRFRAEIEASKAMRGPYVADYFDSDLDDLWLATRFYPWPSLRDHVKVHGPLTIPETANMARQVVEALHHMHTLGFVHRDVTPANILYRDGDVRLIDYGISKSISIDSGEGFTGSNPPPHSWRYASPEHLAKRQVASSSDYFSLGCVLAYAVTGHDLLDDLRIVQHHVVPAPLRPLVYALTRDDPSTRPGYQDVLLAAAVLMEPDGTSRSWFRPSIAASTSGPDHVEVFLSEQLPGRLSHRWCQKGTWTEWKVMELPSPYRDLQVAHLATASRGVGNSELFASLEDGTILHRWYWAEAGWSNWAEFDRRGMAHRLTASSASPDHLEVFTVDGGRIIHRWHTESGGWSGWKHMPVPAGHAVVEAISAAGRDVGKQYLSATLADGSVALTIYSRAEDRWAEWITLFDSDGRPPGATTWANEDEAGVAICFDVAGETWFGQQRHGHEGRGFQEDDDYPGYPLADPWHSKEVIAWTAASDQSGNIDFFALFEDGSVVNFCETRKKTGAKVLRQATGTSLNTGPSDVTELLPRPKRTIPFSPNA